MRRQLPAAAVPCPLGAWRGAPGGHLARVSRLRKNRYHPLLNEGPGRVCLSPKRSHRALQSSSKSLLACPSDETHYPPASCPPLCSRWVGRVILGCKASVQGVEHPPPRKPGSEAPQHPFCMWRCDAATPSHRSPPDPLRAPAAGSPQTWQGPCPNSPLRLDCPVQKAAGSGDPLPGEDPQKGSSLSPKPWELAASL